jgi:hypothetical protein
MLCQNCASIDLSKAHIRSRPNTPDHKLPPPHLRPEILHYDSYAGIIAAAGSCQLCALVVERFDALLESLRPLPKHSIYRSFKHRVFENDSFSEQATSLESIKFWSGDLPTRYFDEGMDSCEVELYVGEGMVPGVPWKR